MITQNDVERLDLFADAIFIVMKQQKSDDDRTKIKICVLFSVFFRFDQISEIYI